MGLNDTPVANRVHIGFFGRTNAGKSSLVNRVTGQEMAVVSEKKGTTTDPVTKTMELLPLGPVLIIDTPGFDDTEQELGEKRVRRTKQILNRSDIAVLVADAGVGLTSPDRELVILFRQKDIPFLIVYNKADLLDSVPDDDKLYVSATTGQGIQELKNKLGSMAPQDPDRRLVGDLLLPGDRVILVTPIDESAPKGRMILPQVQMIRDILDADAAALTVKETGLADLLACPGLNPKMVITDSQAFRAVAKTVPPQLPLTSFSILMARYKGFLETAVKGVQVLQHLTPGDRVLIAEGCTHHRQCNDIGTVKIPRWLAEFTGNRVEIKTCSGQEFPEDLSPYKAVIHCGGCMLNEREVRARMKCAADAGIPFVNYGVAIACMEGILKRSLGLFPELCELV